MKAFTAVTGIWVAAQVWSPAVAGDTWPGWRGPTGQGRAADRDLPLAWGGDHDQNILWKAPLPGADGKGRRDRNQSSPVVWKDRVYVTAACWPEGAAQTEFPEHHVACYAAADGRLVWDALVPPGPWRLTDLRGGYAAPTPATDGDRVYALFGSSVLAAVGTDGRLVWRTEIAPHAWDVAVATSPVLYKDTVLILADGTKPAQSRLIAFDKATGKIRWERPRPKAGFDHTTPLLIEVRGKPQLVVASAAALQGLDPDDGGVIWWADVKGDVPTPAAGEGLVYTEDGRGGSGAAVDPSGEGNVTTTHVRWRTRPVPEGYGSPAVVGEYVYRAHSPGVLTCRKLSSGEEVYSERLPAGVDVSASPLVTPENNLYFATGGKSAVVPAGPKFEVAGTSDLNDPCPASPAAANGRLFLKGAKYLYCAGRK